MNKLKHALRLSSTRPAFLIGTGRSGTHWVGYSLANHPDIRTTIEDKPMFGLATRMALNPALEGTLFKRLVAVYKWQLFRTAQSIYLDKSHPNIWIAERLKSAFPEALFIGVERNPYSTVASMMKHRGVAEWHDRWQEFPLPNRFLGITHELAACYEQLPLASKCAIRWAAHRDRLNELRKIIKDDLYVVSYETFAEDPTRVTQELQQFLQLKTPIPAPNVQKASLHKWETQLTTHDVESIRGIVGFAPEDRRHATQ